MVDGLRALSSTPRRRWLSSFVIFVVIGTVWAVATPLFAAPDEPAHTIRAAGIVRGQLVGETIEGQPEFRRAVEVPEILATANDIGCLAFRADTPAGCLEYVGSTTENVAVVTTAGQHPPAYYAVVGLPSLVSVTSGGIYVMRWVSVLIAAALLASALESLVSLPRARPALLGLLFALTPMVFFVAGSVNPSAAEIAGGVGIWAAGAVLVSGAAGSIDQRALNRAGIASVVMVLSRQLSPLLLALIWLVIAGLAGKDRVLEVARDRRAQVWAGVVVIAGLFQLAWVQFNGTLTEVVTNNVEYGITDTVRFSFGKTFRVSISESVGYFGWLDTPSPSVTIVAWVAGVGALMGLALAVADVRWLVAIAVVAAIVVILPVVAETARADEAGFFWQGRYTLPVTVGLPILAGAALAQRAERISRLSERLYWVLGVAFVVAHVAAMWQHLRRNSVGINGTVNFLLAPGWEPFLPVLFLFVVYLVAVTALALWLLGAHHQRVVQDAAVPSLP